MENSKWSEFSSTYLETQAGTPESLAQQLRDVIERYNPTGFFIARCIVMDSSRLGQRVILPYGGSCTHKDLPEKPFSPRGLASDISEVEMTMEPSEVPTRVAR